MSYTNSLPMKFIKKRWKLLLLLLILGGGAYWWFFVKDNAPKITYVTEKIEKRDVKREVSVTGSVIASDFREIVSPSGEEIVAVNVEVGDRVKKGDELVVFDVSGLEIAVLQAKASAEQAKASLDLAKSGAANEDLALSEKDIATAEVNLRLAEENLEQVKKQNEQNLKNATLMIENAQTGVQNSESRIQNAQKSVGNAQKIAEEAIDDALKSAENAYSSAWSQINSTRVTANAITKKDRYENEVERYAGAEFGNGNRLLLSEAGNGYEAFADKVQKAKPEAEKRSREGFDTPKQAKESLMMLEKLLNEGESLLRQLTNLLEQTSIRRSTSLSMINSAKTEVSGQEQGVFAQSANTKAALAQIENAELNLASAKTQNETNVENTENEKKLSENNLAQAEQNKAQVGVQNETNLKNAQNQVTSQREILEKAKLALKKVQSSPREVELAPSRAALKLAEAQVKLAQNNLAKAKVISPIDGVVTKINAKTGTKLGLGGGLLRIASEENEIIADISETDIGVVQLGQSAKLTFDAFDDDDVYWGEVSKIDPAETVIGGVIYYRVTIEAESQDDGWKSKIKSGMTANVDLQIEQKEDTWSVSPEAINDTDNGTVVKVLVEQANPETGKIESVVVEKDVNVGLEGNRYVAVDGEFDGEEEIVLYEESDGRGW